MRFKHGLGGYRNHKCRCKECRDANTVYVREQRARYHRPKLFLEAEEWMAEGACRGADPNLFHPVRGETTKPAKRICDRCTVKDECLDYAIRFSIKVGIWGGMSERQRRAERARRRQAGAVAA